MNAPELELTVEDRIMLREMEAAFTAHDACDSAFHSLAKAYQRLDCECAAARREARKYKARWMWTVRALWFVPLFGCAACGLVWFARNF